LIARSRFRPRILVLPVAALLIYAAVEYGPQTSPRRRSTQSSVAVMRAPLFEGTDSTRSLFRLHGWLGRHTIFIVFFDGEKGAAADPVLSHLLQHTADLKRTNTYVAAISTALPSQNSTAGFPSSFALVTDLPPDHSIHRSWNCYDDTADKPVTAVFLIDRVGNVPAKDGHPMPLQDAHAEIHRLLGSAHEPANP
jgi:peroxiredoxin